MLLFVNKIYNFVCFYAYVFRMCTLISMQRYNKFRTWANNSVVFLEKNALALAYVQKKQYICSLNNIA